jgi:hypothetical protein
MVRAKHPARILRSSSAERGVRFLGRREGV